MLALPLSVALSFGSNAVRRLVRGVIQGRCQCSLRCGVFTLPSRELHFSGWALSRHHWRVLSGTLSV
jgi:hypothetical protein